MGAGGRTGLSLSRVGQHVAIRIATEPSATTLLKDEPAAVVCAAALLGVGCRAHLSEPGAGSAAAAAAAAAALGQAF